MASKKEMDAKYKKENPFEYDVSYKGKTRRINAKNKESAFGKMVKWHGAKRNEVKIKRIYKSKKKPKKAKKKR